MIDVTLNPHELETAAGIGVRRNIESMAQGKTPAFGMNPADTWRSHIEGAAGEMAVAKAVGIYWSGPINTYRKGGDVGKYQVRTRSRDDAELIVRPADRDEDVFILVTGLAPRFRIVGWLYGYEAKQERFVQDPGGRSSPAFFVPHRFLRPIATLSAVREAGRDVSLVESSHPLAGHVGTGRGGVS